MVHLSLDFGATAIDYLQGIERCFAEAVRWDIRGRTRALFSTCAKGMALNIPDVTRLRVGVECLC